jgi:hypothetical protein
VLSSCNTQELKDSAFEAGLSEPFATSTCLIVCRSKLLVARTATAVGDATVDSSNMDGTDSCAIGGGYALDSSTVAVSWTVAVGFDCAICCAVARAARGPKSNVAQSMMLGSGSYTPVDSLIAQARAKASGT